VEGESDLARQQIARGRPVLALIEDRRGTFHYVVLLGWHERGVIFHDPARTPFRVMAPSTFERQWAAARHWMLILTPGGQWSRDPGPGIRDSVAKDSDACAELIGQGIRQAQADDVETAERTLTSALGCPGPAPLRELAGIRVLQKRWMDVGELATLALMEDPRDEYSWRLLATSRFLRDDLDGALEAWNRIAEPRVDLVQIDGLSRTPHRVVERLLGVDVGDLLTPQALARARRRLTELPAASSARLEYRPAPTGLAELRGFVSERPLLPQGRFAYLSLGLSAAATREIGAAVGSPTGGGENVAVGWRFWRQRPRVVLAVRAPAPWSGVWGVDAFSQQEHFSSRDMRAVQRTGIQLTAADWATGSLAWDVTAGLQSWQNAGTFGATGAGMRFLSQGERADVRFHVTTWSGRNRFATTETVVRWRSTATRAGNVLLTRIEAATATSRTPLDLWFGGDTGQVRPSLLRAHPLLDHGRLRVERLGRKVGNLTLEGQRWWLGVGGIRMGAAAFTDLARTAERFEGRPRDDIDAGVGARFAVPGLAGTFRVDVAKGLRDGSTTASFVYEP
jgi:hypothetical protein